MSALSNVLFQSTSPSPSLYRVSQQKNQVEKFHRSLHIEQVAPKDYPKIREITSSWQNIAKEKMGKSHFLEWERLMVCSKIASSIGYFCAKNDQTRKLYACKDEDGKIHGLSLITNNSPELYVDYLVTSPANIRCQANKVALVEGVGRTFCQYMAEEGPKHGIKSVRLHSVSSAESFYYKSGFRKKWWSGDMVKKLPKTRIYSKL
jgi:hypothetical protein